MTVAVLAMGVAAHAQALQIDGSTTVGPIADAFAEYFKSVQPDLAITVKKTGSGDGAAALTGAQVRDIYAGKITNWSQAGGSNTPIVVISRDTSSGTY
jgi:phosphate transport system substrate-binding protein